MTTYTAPPNQTGLTLNRGDLLVVDAGGVATNTTINSGGHETLYGGLSIDTTVNSGGVINVVAFGEGRHRTSGTSQGTIVNSGGVEDVSASGAATNTTINSGGVQNVFDGATSKGTTINSGGVENVFDRGVTTNATIDAGGVENVYDGGTSKGVTISSGGVEKVATNGRTVGTTINSGGVETVDSGGWSDATRINAGTANVLAGGKATGATIDAGGWQNVSGSAFSTHINKGGEEKVLAGGSSQGAVVLGAQSIGDGGSSTDTTVDMGGREIVTGGTSHGTTINAGGVEGVQGHGSAIGTTINNDGKLNLTTGAKSAGTTINSGGVEAVYFSAAATGTTINAGGVQRVQGTATGTTIEGGGLENVEKAGTATDTHIHASGVENVHGKATGTTIDAGGVENVEVGGVATNTQIHAGGLENVHGKSTGAIIEVGGVANLESDGTAALTTINGGIENVHGYSVKATINAGGIENVDTSHGSTAATTINAGGTENILNGAESHATKINAGGIEIVFAGGTAVNTTIHDGIERVLAGGTANNVTFAGAHSTLELGMPTGLKGTISQWHLGDTIDFLNTAVTGAQKVGDVLTVTYGNNQHASYVVAGQEANTAFALHSDGHGGTDLTLTPLVAGQNPSLPAASDPESQIESLHVGYFGRAGDSAGMTYWQDQLIAGHGSPDALAAIAANFFMQAEAQAAYPFLADPQHATQAQMTSFITSMYENLFDRAPDAADAAYWQQEFSASLGNPQAVGGFILSVIGGAQTQDAATLANKVEAAKFFSDQFGVEHLPFDAAAGAIAHSAIDGVTSDQSTVTTAQSLVSAFVDTVAATTYTAPPTQLHLVLNHGNTLNVQDHGLAYDTTNNGGTVNVAAGGTVVGTTINFADGNAGIATVSGVATDTTITHGFLNVAQGGTSIHAAINNLGALWVYGSAIDTTINDGGTLDILSGTASNVTFGGPSALLSVVGKPSSLTGTISNWQVGDVIDFMNTVVSGVDQTGNKLTVMYGNQTTSYLLAGQQANTEFQLQSDGNGGTHLVLAQQPIVNAIDASSNQIAAAGPNDASVQLVGVTHHLDHGGLI